MNGLPATGSRPYPAERAIRAQPAIYIKLTDPPEPPATPGEDEINFGRWSWTTTTEGPVSALRIDGLAPATPEPPRGARGLTLEKDYDAASAKLMQYCADGHHYDVMELDIVQADGSVRSYQLEDAVITSYSLQRQAEGPPVEWVTVKFERIKPH